ncbi:MAG: N,N-dimethylformamidase beta subunit family domain-containing protein [Acidimicrobiales bacterium]
MADHVDADEAPDYVSSIRDLHAARRAGALRDSLSEEAVSQYEADPYGRHPEPLLRALRFLGQLPAAQRIAVCETVRHHGWRLARGPRARGRPYRLADRRTFSDLGSAKSAALRRELHEVFGWGPDPGADAQDGPDLPADGPVLLGYVDRFSVRVGESITFMLSAEGVGEYTTELVRLRYSDDDPDGPREKIDFIESAEGWRGRHRGLHQVTRVGSHVVVPDGNASLGGRDGFAIAAFVYPTHTGGPQSVLARYDSTLKRGYALGLDEDRRLTLLLGDGERVLEVCASEPLDTHIWYGVGASYSPGEGRVTLATRAAATSVNSRFSPMVVDRDPHVTKEMTEIALAVADHGQLLIGALDPADDLGHFNGKIESPAFWSQALDDGALEAAVTSGWEPNGSAANGLTPPSAMWWLGPAQGADNAADLTVRCITRPELTGQLVNLPVRAVTGVHWDGRTEHYLQDPLGYGAIHFHDDDMIDSGWELSHRLTVPEDLESGVYALRVTATDGSCTRCVPFVVRPQQGHATGDIALLLPTATYLAYANERGLGHVPVVPQGTRFLAERYDLGLSLYASHSDGSGSCMSSFHRPVLTIDPHFKIHLSPLSLTNDLFIVDWLTEQGLRFDVITDHDLHSEGVDLLRPYRAVVTGAHPEYASAQMLDALETYAAEGGNIAYIGGNGFYWVVAFHPDLPHVMEMRRGESGTRTWQARPGEHHLAFTAERGGLWAMRNRAPQKLFGVGFSAQGSGPAGHYRRLPVPVAHPDHELANELLEGVDEIFGDRGLQDGGAVGNEIDRYDPALGSPTRALVLATSEGLSDGYQFVVEELGGSRPGLGGFENPDVRSDIVYIRTRGGGSVFSTGSISFGGALPSDGYQNGISRLTRNVIDHWIRSAG